MRYSPHPSIVCVCCACACVCAYIIAKTRVNAFAAVLLTTRTRWGRNRSVADHTSPAATNETNQIAITGSPNANAAPASLTQLQATIDQLKYEVAMSGTSDSVHHETLVSHDQRSEPVLLPRTYSTAAFLIFTTTS